MASFVRVLNVADPSAFATIYPFADVEAVADAKGRFHAQMTQVRMDGVYVHRVHISQPVITTIAVDPSRRSVGFLIENHPASFLNCSAEVRPGDLVLNRSDVVHHRSGANFHYGMLSLPSDELTTAANAIIGRSLPEKPYHSAIRPPDALMRRLQQLHNAVMHLAHEVPDVLKLPEVTKTLEAELTHTLVRCLADGHSLELTTSRHRTDAFHRFVAFLEANPNRPVHLVEICTAIGVPERTLRTTCEEFLGMSPIRYLTLRRMDQARRTLRDSDPSTTTVTKIATDFGFWELGRFSVAYRTLFGERPSETLRKPTGPIVTDLERALH